MLRRVGQRPVVMLAMDLDDGGADHPENLHADGLVVDEGARAPVRILHAAQDQVAVGVDLLGLGQPARRMVARQVEDGADLALRLAMAHEPAIAAAAERQCESVEEDGFAGAGLAGQHAEPVPKREVETVDQDNVANRQLDQHGGQRRLRRRGMRGRPSCGAVRGGRRTRRHPPPHAGSPGRRG